MEPILRKLFFWDTPAQGAFFGLTQLAILPRLLMPHWHASHRTIDASQIWSVGSNGIDDGGIRMRIESKDDIRFIIPMQTNRKDK